MSPECKRTTEEIRSVIRTQFRGAGSTVVVHVSLTTVIRVRFLLRAVI